MNKRTHLAAVLLVVSTQGLLACSPEPAGIARSQAADTTVKMDFEHRPLPEIPLPNDIATRADPTSGTGLRVNASQIAPTGMEELVRQKVDALDGWGVFQPISIPFTGPLDVQSILDAHRDTDYDLTNDVVYLVDVTEGSEHFGTVHHLDLGNGNYPVVVEKRAQYWDHDPRDENLTLGFEEVDEDLNGNGILDPGEDTDGDGLLDFPNYLPGADPAWDDLNGRADALMSFYESQTNSLIIRPMVPLRERSTYAVVITRRLKDVNGNAVGSPYPWVHHLGQTEPLSRLSDAFANAMDEEGRAVALDVTVSDDVAFAFTFTTQTVEAGWKAVRDGLYGHGLQAHLGENFPAEVEGLMPLKDWDKFPNAEYVHILYGEQWKEIMDILGPGLLGNNPDSENWRRLMEGISYIDYVVMGSYCSPQLFSRGEGAEPFVEGGCDSPDYDPDALRATTANPDLELSDQLIPVRDWKNLGDQSWPEDLDSVEAPTRPERVYFTLIVPRKEASLRGEGKQSKVIIAGHGYGSNRFEGLQWGGYWARHGLATLSIDGPSHGIGIDATSATLARGLLGAEGYGSLVDGLFQDRAWDQNANGQKDSAADFWTGYLFHTRDVVRQFALDYMQLIRILRTWDGTKTWNLDTDGDGQPDLTGPAGDFDGDGQVDVGSDSVLTMAGGSLGGMMSMVMGAVEPELDAVAPMAGGGGVTDLGIRTTQGGAVEGFMLRNLGPLYVGDRDPATGKMTISTIILDLNDDKKVAMAEVEDVQLGDTMVVENLDSGEKGCGIVLADGGVRAAVACDENDPLAMRFYRGQMNLPGTECEVVADASPYAEVTTFTVPASFQYRAFQPGDPLVSLAEGLALPRSHPDLRRFVGIGQLVLDPSDMGVLARRTQKEPMTYPGTGQTTGAHVLQLTTQGDTSVAVAGGLSYARAAGLVQWLETREDLGKSENQHLIDTYVAEGIDLLPRHLDGTGRSVHMDVEHFSQGTHPWDPSTYPTSAVPLHAGVGRTDSLGGVSASFFALTNPTGQHGFELPGGMVDNARRRCANQCAGDPSTCGCDTLGAWDVGTFLLDMAGAYLASGGTELSLDLCHSDFSCPGRAAEPAPRDVSTLP